MSRRVRLKSGHKTTCRLLGAVLLASYFVGSQQGAPAQTTGDYAQAEALVRAYHWDEGLALLEKLLKTEPHNVRDLNLAGLSLTGKGEIAMANEYFQKALAVSPGFVPALKNLGINEFNLKQYDAAEMQLLKARKDVPGDPIVHLYLG